MLTVHGRTRSQLFKGAADWAAVAEVKAAVGLPVVVNGDITDAATASRALALSGADGVMIGRGACGRPWLLAQIAAALDGAGEPAEPTRDEMLAIVLEHHAAMLGHYGRDLGLRHARKHLAWYLAALPGGAGLARRVNRLDDAEAVVAALREIYASAADTEPALAA
ncbi:MAG: tRNA-dihydrouridine synthase, partial [Geminicoccaceae bacterium]|nr:tRNA-dihydrouridine synthase [Geminicoccaceae bacterium]